MLPHLIAFLKVAGLTEGLKVALFGLATLAKGDNISNLQIVGAIPALPA
jgi:hypothetical protein